MKIRPDATRAYVISSRVRLARNMRQHPFPHLAAASEREAVRQAVERVAATHPYFADGVCVPLDRLRPLERALLAERRVISHHFAMQGASRSLILPRAPHVSILVNEEDHLRIQAILPGLDLFRAWRSAERAAQFFEESLDFARIGQHEYVTASPDNAGSGMRASVMLFLPALMLLKQATRLLKGCVRLGCALRGAHGEGSATSGFLLQLSAQPTRAPDVRRTLRTLANISAFIIAQERQARRWLLAHQRERLRQRLAWAGEQLATAQAIDVETGMMIVGLCRLGAALRLSVPHCGRLTFETIDQLEQRIQPAHIRQDTMRVSPETADDAHEHALRAALMRTLLRAA